MVAGARRHQLTRHAEQAAALATCTIAALIISRRLLAPDVFSEDAFVHQYWMWSFRDPALFTDPLTHALRESGRYPAGYQALFWLPAQVISPITFGEWLGVALMAVSGWLVFLIVREHEPWRPAAWIAAALFLALIDIHRFHGGFQRAFVHPIVLLCVLLSIRERVVAAGGVAAAGALVYPPAALLALGVLAATAAWRRSVRRLATVALAGLLAGVIVLGPQLLGGAGTDVFSAAEARHFPDFGPRGPLHFFVPSTLDFLRQNRSGFDLRTSGSLLLLAAIAVLAVRPATLRRLRPEVVVMPLVALAGFAAAHAVLFELYLPHRYTYPLTAFAAIAVGVGIGPLWEALRASPHTRTATAAGLVAPLALAFVAAHWFPLGPLRPIAMPGIATAAAALLVAVLAIGIGCVPGPARARAGALACGVLLAGAVIATTDTTRGFACPHRAATAYLATLPKDTIIAGDPADLECLPAKTRRAVVTSTQLAPSYEPAYFHMSRDRMLAMLQAYYGGSRAALAELHTRYGAGVLWVRRRALSQEIGGRGRRWLARKLPYGRAVRAAAANGPPAALALPAACRRWRSGAEEVYDLRCVARSVERADRLRASRCAVCGARPLPARGERSGRGCRPRACRAGGRRGP